MTFRTTRAFAFLTRIFNDRSVKLRVIAQEIIDHTAGSGGMTGET